MIRSSDWRAISQAAARAVRHADVREEQAQVVVDLGDGPDRRARVARRGLLLDGDRGRQALDQVDVGLLHLLEELARVRRQRLDVAALPFGVDGVEGERRLARPRQARDDDEPLARQIDVDVAEVVDAGAAHRNPVMGHVGTEPWVRRDLTPTAGASRRAQTGNCTRRSATRQLVWWGVPSLARLAGHHNRPEECAPQAAATRHQLAAVHRPAPA